MALVFRPADLARVHAHAEAGYPHEVVGVLAGDRASGVVTAVATLVNERADAAHNRYQVSGLVLQKAERRLEAEGHQILGYYHSHPDHPADWSEFDRDHAWPHMSYLIVSVRQGRVADTRSWRLAEDRSVMEPEPVTASED
jgi:proteasome lid subunit RPN8/RPN11